MLQQSEELSCNLQINYSNVIGDVILPFLIELDVANSNLNPSPGENQRFCYIVTGVGQDLPQFKDLSHLVLGICDEIAQNEIVNVSVTIDGDPQEVIFGPGGNVELRTLAQPDPPTGCPGLKLDFGLNKVGGVMNFCFELTTPYPIGPNNVCLFGGNETKSGLSICGPACKSIQTCEKTAYESSTVCVPVTVTPFATAGTTTTTCCGTPVVTSGETACPGMVNGSCFFTMAQDVCVAVNVEFGSVASTGAPSVECIEATSEDICTNCGSTNLNVTNSSLINTSLTNTGLKNSAKLFSASGKKSTCKCKNKK
ncbi:MAG: hypothetical protein PHV07_00175 [Oscillospiraceae bacterium]|nr:hypothetical protein [Oscillospiraceae bacterium]